MDLKSEILVTAVFFFVVVKTLFYFLGWLFPEADQTYRKHLDSFFDLLDKRSLFELGHITLVRLILIVEKLFNRPVRGFLFVGVISFLLNDLVFVLVSMSVIDSYFIFSDWGIADLQESIEKAGWLRFSGMMLLVGLLGTIFDLFSLAVTLTLLRWASQAKTLLRLSTHLGIDILLATISCMWAYAILDITIRLYYDQLLPIVSDYASDVDDYLGETLWATLNVVQEMWYVVIWLGISAAFPTILYLLVLLPILFLRVLPNTLQKMLSRVVYSLTTDKKPVLFQLSTFLSYSGALLAATITWMSNMSP